MDGEVFRFSLAFLLRQLKNLSMSKVQCAGCGNGFRVPEGFAGGTVCPVCDAVVAIDPNSKTAMVVRRQPEPSPSENLVNQRTTPAQERPPRVHDMRKSYLTDGRLEDVIRLIQFLGLGEFAHRNENVIKQEIDSPSSARSWKELASDHREFFRIGRSRDGDNDTLALLSRHLKKGKADGDGEDPLGPQEIFTLVDAAIKTHASQVQRSQLHKEIRRVGAWVLAFSALVSLIAAGLPELIKHLLEKFWP